MKNDLQKIIEGLELARDYANSIHVSGINNFQKLSAIYNNINVVINMLKKGEIVLSETTKEPYIE